MYILVKENNVLDNTITFIQSNNNLKPEKFTYIQDNCLVTQYLYNNLVHTEPVWKLLQVLYSPLRITSISAATGILLHQVPCSLQKGLYRQLLEALHHHHHSTDTCI
jgi:hypothetical protein